jgi:6-phosphogluconolactonase/glucosamine-6-phosphate isomerase/deaminase
MRYRVTLLRGVLESARHTLCLATGAEKAEALRKVLREPYDPQNLPAQISSNGTVWYVDNAAATRSGA